MTPDPDLFEEAGRAWGVDPALLQAIQGVESGGNDAAVSPKGAQGRMQLMPATAQALGVTNTADPVQSVFGAAKLMRQNLDAANGDVVTALRLYQGGPNAAGWGAQNAAYPGQVLGKLKVLRASTQQAAQPSSASAPDAFSALFGNVSPEAKDDATIKSSVDKLRAQQDGSAPVDQPATTATAAFSNGGDAFSTLFGAALQQPAIATATAKKADPYGPLASDIADAHLVALQQAEDKKEPAESVLNAAGSAIGQAANAIASIPGKAVAAAGTLGEMAQEAATPTSGTTYGSVLPIARDNATGALRPALPQQVRDLLQGGIDLINGPQTGAVTPAASNALFAAMTGGGARSVAVGTGGMIGNRLLPAGSAALGRNETPNLLGARFTASPSMTPDALTPSAVGPASPVAQPPAVVNALTGGRHGAAKIATDAAAASPEAAPASAVTSPAAPVRAAAPTDPAALAAFEQSRLANPRTTQAGYDPTVYVPGSKPTLAEVSGRVEDANDQRFLANQPDSKAQFRQVQTDNDAARLDYLNQVAGDRQTLANAIQARDAQAQKDLAAAWQNKQPTDGAPVVDQIDQILAGPSGKLAAVKSALTRVRNNMMDAEGNIETDPEILYGVRKDVADMLGKAAQQETPTLRNAASQLNALKGTLDDQIELGAPGYQQYLSNYATASRPIDSMSLLQDALPSLQVGSDKKLTFAGFNRFMKGIVDARQAPGANDAKSLDAPTMDRLWNVYSDLHRMQTAQDIGGTAGSSTVPWASQAMKFGVEGAGHLAAAVATGGNPVANMLLRGAVTTIKTARSGAKRTARVNALLDGSNYQP